MLKLHAILARQCQGLKVANFRRITLASSSGYISYLGTSGQVHRDFLLLSHGPFGL